MNGRGFAKIVVRAWLMAALLISGGFLVDGSAFPIHRSSFIVHHFGTALAHEGEAHGPPAALPAAPVQGQNTREGQSDQYELLIKFASPVPGEKTTLRLFLSDYRTNAPVPGASIELEMGDLKVTVRAGQTAGIYEGEVTFPSPGIYESIVSISRGDSSDLLNLPEINVEAPAATVSAVPRWLIPAGVTVAAAVIILLLLRRWRQRSAWLKGEPVA